MTLVPTGMGKAIGTRQRVWLGPLSTLRSLRRPTLGLPLDIALGGPTGLNYAILLGAPARGYVFPNQERIHVSLAASFLIGAGTIPATGTANITRTIPNLPELRFGMLNIQGATSGPSSFQITNTLSISPQ